ncbi:MAG TPA: DUF5652 family protein [Bacteroidia bacterium]|jgi:hypothetical protein|nr:DUF5652 family protein [Bacteroidia bacterium]
MDHQILQTLVNLIPIIIALAVWEAVWKLIALWKAGRNNHLAWFICIALINTAGILPIVYILKYRRKNQG